jgi:hypothetical protein
MRDVSRLCELYPGICLTTEEKHEKTSWFLGFVYFSAQTTVTSLYNINRLVWLTVAVCLLRGTSRMCKYRVEKCWSSNG